MTMETIMDTVKDTELQTVPNLEWFDMNFQLYSGMKV